MAVIPKHPRTIRPLTKGASAPTIASSQRGTGADLIPVTKFAANTVVTPLQTFGIAFGGKMYSFVNGFPRVVSPPLRARIIALSNARADKYVKEVS